MPIDLETSAGTNGAGPKTTREVLQMMEEKEREISKSGDDDKSGNWARSEVALLRSSAMDTKSIFSFCFVAPRNDLWSSLYGITMLLVAVFIQTVVPISIIATLQPIADIDPDVYGSQACPNRSNGLTKTIAFVLSVYFVVLTISLCTNKLRGLGFLHEFVHLGRSRALFIELGIASQMIGMAAAGGAQYLLFIGNGDASYLILLLQSLAMQFCLTVDQRLVSDVIGKRTNARLAKLTKDELLCSGIGVGEDEQPMPKETLASVNKLVGSEKLVLAMVSIAGLAWSVGLAVCI